jgi:hypothetical protein
MTGNPLSIQRATRSYNGMCFFELSTPIDRLGQIRVAPATGICPRWDHGTRSVGTPKEARIAPGHTIQAGIQAIDDYPGGAVGFDFSS